MATLNLRATADLVPQVFGPGAATQLPAIDFYADALAQLPQVYHTAPNFLALVRVIATRKQYLYDIIRSLINSNNLNDAGNVDDALPPAFPLGVYSKMLASVFATPYSVNDNNDNILTAVRNSVIFVNSRGLPSDFYNYFANNGLQGFFTNYNVEENGNATLVFNVPVANLPIQENYCLMQVNILEVGEAPPYFIPIGWAATGFVTTSPYVTIQSYEIDLPGRYFIAVYSTDITTPVPENSFTGGDAVTGITFGTITNITAANLVQSNPYAVFINAMQKIKAAGVEVDVNAQNIPFFQYSSLPTDTPPYEVAPGNAGFGILQNNGLAVNGGFFGSL